MVILSGDWSLFADLYITVLPFDALFRGEAPGPEPTTTWIAAIVMVA